MHTGMAHRIAIRVLSALFENHNQPLSNRASSYRPISCRLCPPRVSTHGLPAARRRHRTARGTAARMTVQCRGIDTQAAVYRLRQAAEDAANSVQSSTVSKCCPCAASVADHGRFTWPAGLLQLCNHGLCAAYLDSVVCCK